MTVQECYAALGGDYDDVMRRFRTEEKVRKFALMFLRDTSYSDLCAALAQGDAETAFRAAHTLKGVGQNLGFTALYQAASELTELLRGGQMTGAQPLKAAVDEAFARTDSAVRALAAEG